MFTKPTHCPNMSCKFAIAIGTKFYIKKGYYKTEHNGEKSPRYQCRIMFHFLLVEPRDQGWEGKQRRLNRSLYMCLIPFVQKYETICVECPRRTWVTTKDWKRLRQHLHIYIAWNNGHNLRV